MNAQLKKKLISLADKYETDGFLMADPSKFFHRYSSVRDKEVAAFISASLAFGNRRQILSHIQMIFDDVDRAGGKKNSSPAEYILSGKYNDFFKPADDSEQNASDVSVKDESDVSVKNAAGGLTKDAPGVSAKDAVTSSTDLNKSFYRVFTYANMRAMFDVLKEILTEEKTMGAYFKKRYTEACRLNETNADTRASAVNKKDSAEPPLYEIIRAPFLNRGCGNLIPYTKNSACKRIQLFLRWMVRDNSPVDMGLWKWYDKSKLLLPLDVHVLEESVKFGLLKPAGGLASKKIPSATIKMAIELTEQMKLVWPDDPVKGDYALFGLGVN